MEILTTQSICKEAPLTTRLHTNKIEGFWGCLKRWMPRSGLATSPRTYTTNSTTNRINKWNPFLVLVNLVEENNPTDVMDAAHDIFLMLKGVTTRKKMMHVF